MLYLSMQMLQLSRNAKKRLRPTESDTNVKRENVKRRNTMRRKKHRQESRYWVRNPGQSRNLFSTTTKMIAAPMTALTAGRLAKSKNKILKTKRSQPIFMYNQKVSFLTLHQALDQRENLFHLWCPSKDHAFSRSIKLMMNLEPS